MLIVVFSSTIPTTLHINFFDARHLGTSGMLPLYMAFAVATKQLMIDTEIYVTALFRFRSDNLPLVGLLIVFVLGLIFGLPTFVFGLCGFISSWIYLRFFQHKPGGIVGDPSNIFAMHTFFPEAVQGPIKSIEAFFGKLASLNPLKRFRSGRNNAINAGEEYVGNITVEINSVDAERHKQIALNAVNEKLGEDNN